jgi:hypothetical protein
VSKWHPATKLLALVGLLVLPYLLWTRTEEDAAPAVASVARAVTLDEGAEAANPTPPLVVLPPLERLTEVVERPLFSPTRRMPPPPRQEAEAAPAEPELPAARGPAEPELRFFGTVRQGGTAAALVTYPATAQVARLQPGDLVGEWQVLSVGGNRLELGLGEERRSYEIFGVGTSGRGVEQAEPAQATATGPAETLPTDEAEPAQE